MRVLQRNEGYAIVAAVLILFLVTGLGVVAMVTSGTEQTINTNMNDSQTMFYYAQQSIDRVLSHLSYLEGGLFTSNKGLGLSFRGVPDPIATGNAATDLLLPTVRVLADTSGSSGTSREELYFNTQGGSNGISLNPNMHVEAYLDPKDLQSYFDRGISRPVAITSLVRNNFTKVQHVFRAFVQPYSIWDFGYFAMNQTPWQRTLHSGTGEFCNAASSTWRNCQTVFFNEDQVVGDMYLGGTWYEPKSAADSSSTYFTELYNDGTNTLRQTTGLFVRGAPTFGGEVRWRDLKSFHNYSNQTAGGQGVQTVVKPRLRFRNMVKPVMPPRLETFLQSGSQGSTYREKADIYLKLPPMFNFTTTYGESVSNQKTVWKILFRTDIWPNPAGGGVPSGCANGIAPPSRVASRITNSTKSSQSPLINCTDFDKYPGAMMIYRLPFPDPANPSPLDNDFWQAAMYGDGMTYRDAHMKIPLTEEMRSQNLGGILLDGSFFNNGWFDFQFGGAYGGQRSIMTRINDPACPGLSANCHGNYDKDDIYPSYTFMAAPARGFTPPAAYSDGSGPFNGIIFVEGDVLVSGVVRGQITIVATGNIYLDHEIQYETNPDAVPLSYYNDLRQPDMLALVAAGNIIIPNSYPGSSSTLRSAKLARHPYRDDWSDPDNSFLDKPYKPIGQYDQTPVLDDHGNKAIHAVMISYGFKCTQTGTGRTGANFLCRSPDMSATGAADWNDIVQFRTGLYAMPRTVDYSWYANLSDPPYQLGGAFAQQGGNESGQLQIIGAVIQNVAGRLAYDDKSGSCANGVSDSGGTCNKIGFSSIMYQYDTRLKFLLPPYPGENGLKNQNGPSKTSAVIPFGYAAWDIVSWQQLPDTEPPANNVW